MLHDPLSGYRFIFSYNQLNQTTFHYQKSISSQHPILQGYFDNVSKVIAKMEISDVTTFEQKNIVWLFTLLDETPKWIGVL